MPFTEELSDKGELCGLQATIIAGGTGHNTRAPSSLVNPDTLLEMKSSLAIIES
jgi:hypothetical protein